VEHVFFTFLRASFFFPVRHGIDETADVQCTGSGGTDQLLIGCVLDRTTGSSRPPVLHGFDSLHKFRPDRLLMCMFHHYSFICVDHPLPPLPPTLKIDKGQGGADATIESLSQVA